MVNWIKDGILCVKDTFDEDEEIYDISYCINILRKGITILCKYEMLKKAIKECINLFKFSNANHVQNIRSYNFCLKPMCSCLFIF